MTGSRFMSDITTCAAAMLIATALMGCAEQPLNERSPVAAGTHAPAQFVPVDLRSIVDAAAAELGSRLHVDPAAVEVVSALQVTWSDGSVGCPAPGMQYTQALVPGYRVILRAGDQLFDYHAAANGHLVLCPPERAIEPILNDPI